MPQDQSAADRDQGLPDVTRPDGAHERMADGAPPPPVLAAQVDTMPSAAARFAADLAAPTRFGADKFDVEARLIEFGGALAAAQELFKALERDFYRAAFGRYDE